MKSDLYMKLLHEVEELLQSHPHGDIGMGYVMLTIRSLADEKDKIAYLQDIIRNRNGSGEKLGKRVAESVKEFQRHTEDMGYGDNGES